MHKRHRINDVFCAFLIFNGLPHQDPHVIFVFQFYSLFLLALWYQDFLVLCHNKKETSYGISEYITRKLCGKQRLYQRTVLTSVLRFPRSRLIYKKTVLIQKDAWMKKIVKTNVRHVKMNYLFLTRYSG